MEVLSKVKKSELHLHLGGSYPISYLESIADSSTFEQLKNFLDLMELKSKATDYHACFGAFAIVNKIIDSYIKVENGTEALCKWLVEDGVSYVEIRTSAKDFGTGWEDYVRAVLKGVERGCRGTDLSAAVLLSLRRSCSREVAQETLRLIKMFSASGSCEDFAVKVVGLDISDNSTIGDSCHVYDILPELKEMGIPVTLHIGECKEETDEQQMSELERYQPRRIGHGVHLCDAARKWVLDRRIPIEMCLSSSVLAQMTTEIHHHPSIKLLKEGYPVAICTDDPLIFQTSLSAECALALEALGFQPHTDEYVQKLEEIQLATAQYRF
jgi:adenosine deaminase